MEAPLQRFRLGAIEITRLTEITFDSFAPDFLLPAWHAPTVEPHLAGMREHVLNGDGTGLLVYVNCWIVRTPYHHLVIDTGIGDGRNRRIPLFNDLQTGWLDRMRQAGIDPAMIDHVLCTHLHSDHVGWNTHLSHGCWVPSFPNARYHWSRMEDAFAASPAFRDSLAAGVFEDSVQPVIEAGLVDLVNDTGGEVLEGVTFHPTPGHTPGHMSISVRDGDYMALFSGDVVHSPLQVHLPDWNSAFCEAPDAARASRRWALNHAADHRALFLPAHFGGSSAGHVTRDGDGFRWTFA